MTQSLNSAPSARGDPTPAANPSNLHPLCLPQAKREHLLRFVAAEKMSDVLSLLPVDDPSLTDEVSWVPASPLPEEPVQVFFAAVRTFDTFIVTLPSFCCCCCVTTTDCSRCKRRFESLLLFLVQDALVSLPRFSLVPEPARAHPCAGVCFASLCDGMGMSDNSVVFHV